MENFETGSKFTSKNDIDFSRNSPEHRLWFSVLLHLVSDIKWAATPERLAFILKWLDYKYLAEICTWIDLEPEVLFDYIEKLSKESLRKMKLN